MLTEKKYRIHDVCVFTSEQLQCTFVHLHADMYSILNSIWSIFSIHFYFKYCTSSVIPLNQYLSNLKAIFEYILMKLRLKVIIYSKVSEFLD